MTAEEAAGPEETSGVQRHYCWCPRAVCPGGGILGSAGEFTCVLEGWKIVENFGGERKRWWLLVWSFFFAVGIELNLASTRTGVKMNGRSRLLDIQIDTP